MCPMQKLPQALAFVAIASLPLGACDKKPSSATTSASPAASAAAAAPAPVQPVGTLDVEIDDEYTTMKVGAAYAIPTQRDDGVLYYFMAFNAGARDTSCATTLKGENPVGGDNWAVSLDMSTGSTPFKPTEKNKEYDDVSASVFFVAKSGTWKGAARGLNPFGSDAEKKLTIVSADAESVSVKIDVSNKSGHVKGEFKAKLCPAAK